MQDAAPTRLRPLADTSTSAVVAGFIAMLTGYTSSLVLMFQAGQAAGLSVSLHGLSCTQHNQAGPLSTGVDR